MRTSAKMDHEQLAKSWAKIDTHDCSIPRTKNCPKCGPQPLERFGKNKRRYDGLESYCKDCRSEESAAYYESLTDSQKEDRYRKSKALKNVRQEFVLWHLMAHPCADCGESDPIVLEFDHVRGTKSANISDLIDRHAEIVTIEEEIAKCEVVCANCHARRTAQRGGHHKIRLLGEMMS